MNSFDMKDFVRYLNIYFDKNLYKIFPILGSHKIGINLDEKYYKYFDEGKLVKIL